MIDPGTQQQALRDSTLDGAFAAVMGAWAGGMFLMGFALKILHATTQQIGMLAALPTFANFTQILGAYLIETMGKRKSLCVWFNVASRLLWLFIIGLPLAMFNTVTDWRVWILAGVMALSTVCGALGGVAWLSWMSDLVPEDRRGTYFGKRNMIASACGTVALLAGGKFITLWEQRFTDQSPYAFVILFALGLLAGMVSLCFLSRVPEVPAVSPPADRFRWGSFFQPLRDRNFLTLTLFVGAWTFAVQLAAPFYGVLMIEYLQIDFSTIMLLNTFATVATVIMMKIWGPIADKLGNKPVILVSGGVLMLVPCVWIVALPTAYMLPLSVAHLLSGAFLAGASLSQFNILLKLSPRTGRAVYLAVYAAVTGLVGGLAPILGGSLSHLLQGVRITVWTYTLTHLHLIFLLSAMLQALVIFFVLRVHEAGAATPVAVILQLRNDLDPQNGIASALDVAMVELERTEGVLRQLDRVTDELAEASEKNVARFLDRWAHPLKRLKDFLQDFLSQD